MTHKHIKKLLAMMLAVVLTVSALTGCADEDSSSVKENDSTVSSAAQTESKPETDSSQGEEPAPAEEEDKPAITASAVKFASSGKYTTTVKSEKVDLSGISTDKTEVTYIALDEEALYNALEAESSDENAKAGKYAPGERAAKIDEVKKNDDGSFDITFTDENVGEFKPTQYLLRFEGIDDMAAVNVETEEFNITADTTEINSTTTEAKVTLTLDNGEFADEVTEAMISTECAFRGMNVESISASGKNLTVQLKGSVTQYGDEGAYTYGIIRLKPDAVKDCTDSLYVMINIQTEYCGFDGATLKCEDGKITAELKSYVAADLDKLTKENLKIKGVTVESVEKKDDNTALVTMTAKDVKDVNGFVKLVSGKEADFGGYKTMIDLGEASFYPVFDLCVEDGDNLKMTLLLYIFGGTFDKDISAESISFDGGLADAKTESVKVESDTTVELVLTVPANGQKADDFSVSGDVKLAAGSMTSKWGEKTSEEAVYSRVYSQDTLGKASVGSGGGSIDSLSPKALGQIQEWVRGKETWYGNAFYYGNMAVSGFSAVKQVLELVGVLKSEHQQVMDALKEIQKTLKDMQNTVEDISKDVKETKKAVFSSSLEMFERDAFELYDALIGYTSVMTRAGKDLEKEQGVTISEDATPEEALEYQHKLYDLVEEKLKKNKRDANYANFDNYYDTITKMFSSIAGNYLSGNNSNNPLVNYDRLYTTIYNFDTEAYLPRVAVREVLRTNLIEAMTIITARFEMTGTEPEEEWSKDYKKFKGYFDTAMKTMDSMEVTGISPDQVYFDDKEVEVEVSNSPDYIGEIMVYADKDATAKDKLEQKGYTVINYDLNKNAGGYYIYLGYKTTKDYNKAIKSMIIRKGKGSNQDTYKHSNGLNYKICPYDGVEKFKNEKGALNCNAGGTWLRLYYSTEEHPDHTAYTDIYANNAKSGSVSNMDLNDDSGGDDIYLHGSFLPKPSSYIKDVTVFKADSADQLPNGYEAAVPMNLNSGNSGDQLYIAYSFTTNADEAVKSLILDTDNDGAEKIDVNGVEYTLCQGSGSDGNVNAGNEGIPMWLYYTKTQQGGNEGALASLEISSDASGAVSGMDINAGAGGDLIYLHTFNVNPNGKTVVKKRVGNDPAYYPFCYALGTKIRVETARQDKKLYPQYYSKPGWLTWKALPSMKRNWKNTEVTEFATRLDGRTLEQDLKLAGFNLKGADRLVTEIKVDYDSFRDDRIKVKYWTIQHVKCAYFHNNTSTHTPKTEIDPENTTWAYFKPV